MFLAVREGNLQKADSLNHLDSGGEAYTVVFKLVDAYRRRDVAAQQRLVPIYLKQLKALNNPNMPADPAAMVVFMSVYGGDIRTADEALLQLPIDSVGKPPAAQARRTTARLAAIMHGNLKHDAGRTQMPSQVVFYTPYDDLVFEPFTAPTREDLLRVRDRVLRSDSTPRSGENPAAALAPQFRLYWAALANCKLGNIPEALQQAERMESLSVPPYWHDAMHALATDVRAFADVAKGNTNQALRRIEGINVGVPIDLLGTPANRHIETVWRGELLYRAGRYDEALQWFENLTADPDYIEVIPFYLLRRAQIHDRRGETQKAALLYAKFLEYWKAPDAELQPLVNEARQRLAVIQHKVD